MSLLKQAEKLEGKVKNLIEGAFRKEAREPLEIRRAILGEIEQRIEPVGRDKKTFPFRHLRVRLFASDPQRRAIFKAVFVEDRQLEKHILELLRRNCVHLPPDLQISVQLVKRAVIAAESSEQGFSVDYQGEPAKAQSDPEMPEVLPEVHLTILRGHTTRKSYRLAKSRINLGRLAEVVDDHHRIVRRNDVVFREGDIDQTVSREHAHIRLDERTGELRLHDDGSAYGTRILRNGQTIEVHASNRRGAKLYPGDEVFLGEARFQFDVLKPK